MKQNSRQANIEILRIISMFLVLLGHYHLGINGNANTEMVKCDFWRAAGIVSLNSIVFVCVNCFIVISGYFGIHWKLKGITNYWFQIVFWAFLTYLICSLFGYHIFEWNGLLKQTGLGMFFMGNWFFTAYLGLYILAPVLNSFVKDSDEKRLGLFLFFFLIFQTIYGYVFKTRGEFNQGLTTMSFIGFYMIGAYLRRTTLSIFHWKAWKNLAMFLGVGVLLAVSSLITKWLGATKDVYSYISPFVIIQTVYLFLFCKKLKIERGEKLILFFSSSAFAGLLSHSWDGAGLYHSGLEWIDLNLSFPFFPSLTFIICWFSIAVCLDKIRIYVWDKLSHFYFKS